MNLGCSTLEYGYDGRLDVLVSLSATVHGDLLATAI